MRPDYTADIGLEIHAELQTKSKMFCACPVVDLTQTPPNTAVCPVCAGIPGTLPMVNQQAVNYALRVAVALDCDIAATSRFARKNYFYPDLPKGYQISQYEFPLAERGSLLVNTEDGWFDVVIRRVHLEEDTAKLTHILRTKGKSYTLVDLNRAGIPLLEIVSEPNMHTIEQVSAYTRGLRRLLQYLEVNSGDLEKGVIRFEANVSVRPTGRKSLGTRVELKNLNSFRAMTAAIAFELERQSNLLASGGKIAQETLGWDEVNQVTVSQRIKEEAHDYRYFPEPDLPPLTISPAQVSATRTDLPELPVKRTWRFMVDFGLDDTQAELMTAEKDVADYFELTLTHMAQPDPQLAVNWITGTLFGLMNISGECISEIAVSPNALASLLDLLQNGKLNNTTAKSVLAKMFETGQAPEAIIYKEGLKQISDRDVLSQVVEKVLAGNPKEVQAYRRGKTILREWFFGQVIAQTHGQADPEIVGELLDKKLSS